MELDHAEMTSVINRIKRARGQLDGSKALDRAGFAIISTGLRHCLTNGDGLDGVDARKMEKLFLSLG